MSDKQQGREDGRTYECEGMFMWNRWLGHKGELIEALIVSALLCEGTGWIKRVCRDCARHCAVDDKSAKYMGPLQMK